MVMETFLVNVGIFLTTIFFVALVYCFPLLISCILAAVYLVEHGIGGYFPRPGVFYVILVVWMIISIFVDTRTLSGRLAARV